MNSLNRKAGPALTIVRGADNHFTDTCALKKGAAQVRTCPHRTHYYCQTLLLQLLKIHNTARYLRK